MRKAISYLCEGSTEIQSRQSCAMCRMVKIACKEREQKHLSA